MMAFVKKDTESHRPLVWVSIVWEMQINARSAPMSQVDPHESG
jgi:hypothetical protein